MPRWIAWTLLTLLSWGIWVILSGRVGNEFTAAQCQAVSTLGMLPILMALGLLKDSPGTGNYRTGVLLALGSGIISCLGNVACYESLKHAKAATVIPLTAMYPVVTVLLAIPLLKERVNFLQWIGICLSLGAIYLFNTPQGIDTGVALGSTWLILPLAAVLFWGVAGLMQKAATNHISARSSAIWFFVAFLPMAGLILWQDPLPTQISPQTWIIATAIGFTLALGNFTVLLAFASGGKASIITPLAGLYPLVSIPIAIVGFGERLTWRESSGIVLALAAVLLLSLQSEPAEANSSTLTTDATL